MNETPETSQEDPAGMEICSLKFNWADDEQECDGKLCTWWADVRCAVWWPTELESDLNALSAAKTT
jgi:hypothetical protein